MAHEMVPFALGACLTAKAREASEDSKSLRCETFPGHFYEPLSGVFLPFRATQAGVQRLRALRKPRYHRCATREEHLPAAERGALRLLGPFGAHRLASWCRSRMVRRSE